MFGKIIYIKNNKLRFVVFHISMTFCFAFIYTYIEAWRNSDGTTLILLNKALIFSVILSVGMIIFRYLESRHIQKNEKYDPEEQINK